jgi:hypothetical protein
MKAHHRLSLVVILAITALAACSNGTTSADSPTTKTYTSFKTGVLYELTLTMAGTSSALWTIAPGDSFTLKVTSSSVKVSSGTVQSVAGEVLTLQPKSSGAGTFTVTISGGESMTKLGNSGETITFDDGVTEPAPETLISVDNPPPSDGSLGSSVSVNEQVYVRQSNHADPTSFPFSSATPISFMYRARLDPDPPLSIDSSCTASVGITGMLTLNLGTPTGNWDTSALSGAGLTTINPSDKIYMLYTFRETGTNGAGTNPQLELSYGRKMIMFFWVDKAVRITEIIPDDVYGPHMVNLNLKPGWNEVIDDADQAIMESGIHDSNFKWQIEYK